MFSYKTIMNLTWIQYGRYCAFAGYIADNIFKLPLLYSSNAYDDNIILDYDGDGSDDFIWAHVSVPKCEEAM